MRSPLTGMMFVLELTHDINALPVLLVATVTALGFTVLLMRRSILTEKLARRGQHIAREYSVDIFELQRVGDVMDREPPILSENTTVTELAGRIARGEPGVARRQSVILVDADRKLAGIVTRGDLFDAQQRDDLEPDSLAIDAGSREVVVCFPDETLHEVISRMVRHEIGRLPVVHRDDPLRVVGYLGRADILRAKARSHSEEEHRERGPLLRRSRT